MIKAMVSYHYHCPCQVKWACRGTWPRSLRWEQQMNNHCEKQILKLNLLWPYGPALCLPGGCPGEMKTCACSKHPWTFQEFSTITVPN
jgi:hypothetical protein